jgi:hypothetical protein
LILKIKVLFYRKAINKMARMRDLKEMIKEHFRYSVDYRHELDQDERKFLYGANMKMRYRQIGRVEIVRISATGSKISGTGENSAPYIEIIL